MLVPSLVAMLAASVSAYSSNLSLALDIRGTWMTTGDRIANCDAFARSVARFGGRSEEDVVRMLCTPDMTIVQHIWQECLEMTITAGADVHHMILDGEYLTDDFHASGKPAAWKSYIEAPLPSERADGCLLYTSPSPRDS